MNIKTGTRVIVLEDCRNDGKATGMQGVLEKYAFLEYHGESWGTPYIQLDSGSTIWGYECWWSPVADVNSLAEAQRGLRELKEKLGAKILDYG